MVDRQQSGRGETCKTCCIKLYESIDCVSGDKGWKAVLLNRGGRLSSGAWVPNKAYGFILTRVKTGRGEAGRGRDTNQHENVLFLACNFRRLKDVLI